jgi:hypothetical protein
MCWAHALRAIEKRVITIPNAQDRKEILDDIYKIQCAYMESNFDVLNMKFFAKYENKSKKIDEFLKYYKDNWLGKLKGWYEGVAPRVPSTNNSLESVNRRIKDLHTLRERKHLSVFFSTLESLVKNWSLDESFLLKCLELTMKCGSLCKNTSNLSL